MTVRTKAESIIGFAMKAGKITFGADNIEKSRKNRLIICDKDLSENTLKRMIALAGEAKIRLLIADKQIEEIVFKKSVKVIAITDRQMSNAILKDFTGFDEKIVQLQPQSQQNGFESDRSE